MMKILFLLILVSLSSSFLAWSKEGGRVVEKGEAKTTYKYEWLDWKPGLFESYRKEGKVVWLSFTADWCMLCKANEARVFSDKKVLKELEKHRVVLIRADLTERDAKIVEEMKKYGMTNVPANLIGPAKPKAKVIMTPEIFGRADAIKALKKAVLVGK